MHLSRRASLAVRAVVAELAVRVVAPALDAAVVEDDARVLPARRDCSGAAASAKHDVARGMGLVDGRVKAELRSRHMDVMGGGWE